MRKWLPWEGQGCTLKLNNPNGGLSLQTEIASSLLTTVFIPFAPLDHPKLTLSNLRKLGILSKVTSLDEIQRVKATMHHFAYPQWGLRTQKASVQVFGGQHQVSKDAQKLIRWMRVNPSLACMHVNLLCHWCRGYRGDDWHPLRRNHIWCCPLSRPPNPCRWLKSNWPWVGLAAEKPLWECQVRWPGSWLHPLSICNCKRGSKVFNLHGISHWQLGFFRIYFTILDGSRPQLADKMTFGWQCRMRVASSLAEKPGKKMSEGVTWRQWLLVTTITNLQRPKSARLQVGWWPTWPVQSLGS